MIRNHSRTLQRAAVAVAFAGALACGMPRTPQAGTGAVIEGTIDAPEDSMVYLFAYADSLDRYIDRMTAIDSAVLDAGGRFTMHPAVTAPAIFSLRHANTDLVANGLLLPDSRLSFRFMGRDHRPRIEPIGMAARFNAYLIQFQDSFYRGKEAYRIYYIVANFMSPDEFARYTVDRKKRMQAFFDGFFGSDSLPPPCRSLARYSIDYEFASDRLMYVWKKRMKGESERPDSAFFDFLTPAFVDNADALVSPSYIRFVNLYIKHLYETAVENAAWAGHLSRADIPAVARYRLCDSLLTPPVRDAVFYDLFITDRQDLSVGQDALPAIRDPDTLRAAFERKYGLGPGKTGS